MSNESVSHFIVRPSRALENIQYNFIWALWHSFLILFLITLFLRFKFTSCRRVRHPSSFYLYMGIPSHPFKCFSFFKNVFCGCVLWSMLSLVDHMFFVLCCISLPNGGRMYLSFNVPYTSVFQTKKINI